MSPRGDTRRSDRPATFDTELLQLVKELAEAHRKARETFALAEEAQELGDEEAAQEHGAAAIEHDRLAAAIARRMTAIPADTLEGMRAKARAVEWFYPDAVIDLGIRGRATDVDMAESIIADLLRGPSSRKAPGRALG